MKTLVDLFRFFQRRLEDEQPSAADPSHCPNCGSELTGQPLYQQAAVCAACSHHFTLSARRRIDLLLDAGTFRELLGRLSSTDPLQFHDRVSYPQRLAEAQRKTGLTDAVVFGTGQIGGHAVVLAVMDFEFMGGSMGSVVGEKITTAFETAVRRRLPIITVANSGGARMQEGMLSLVQMAKTSAAVQRLHGAGLPFVSVLASPTTGGILASFASLGDLTVAETGALISFAGPRVVEEMTGRRPPTGAFTAEAQLAAGMVDHVIDRLRLRDYLIRVLALVCATSAPPRDRRPVDASVLPEPDESPWEVVRMARRPDRPTALAYIERMTAGWTELHGDRVSGDDPAIVCGLADLGGQAVMLIGHERGRDETDSARRRGGRPSAMGFRKAQRGLTLAAKYRLPVITLVDTPGADLDRDREPEGIARAIAATLARMSDLPIPIVSAIIGEGGSGGALALGVADRILMLEHAIYSVIAPEGAAAILYRDATRAAELSRALKLTAHDCKHLGVIDIIVPEPPGAAHSDPDAAAERLKAAILRELGPLRRRSPKRLVADRYKKFRALGRFEQAGTWDVSRLVNRLPLPARPRPESRSAEGGPG